MNMIGSPTKDAATRATNRWQGLALLLVVGSLLWLLGPVLTPFVVSALLAWLGDPLIRRIQRTGRSRTTAVCVVFALMSTLVVVGVAVLVPILEHQIATFVEWLPQLAVWINGRILPWIQSRLHIDLSAYLDPDAIVDLLKANWQRSGGTAAKMLGRLSQSGLVVMAWLANLVLIPIVTFYFMRDWSLMIEKVRGLLPRRIEPTATRLAGESDEVLGGFLRGQFSVMLSLGSIYGIGLWMVGLDLGLLIGLIAGLVSFVPYLGAFIGLSAAIVATLVEHGDLMHLGLVLTVFAVGQTAESFFLTPWLVGDRIGMHPVAVIFAIMAGGQLFGFLGVLLALPVAAVAMVLLRYAHSRYTESSLYQEESEPVILAVSDVGPDHGRGPTEHFPPSGPAA